MQSISIVIPVYNRAHIVERTLQSVLAQSYRPLQVVLVDNDSSDDTLAVLRGFAAAHSGADFDVQVVTESHHTAGAARNRGAQVASGDWLVFFDSDDEMHPDLVKSYVQQVENAKGRVDIVSTKATLRFTDGTTQELPFHTSDILAVQVLNSQLATQRYMVRAEFFHKCDEWNINLPVWNDWELGMRMLLHHPRIAYLDRSLVTVNHSGEASITGTSFSSKAGLWEHVIDVVEVEVKTMPHSERKRLLRLLEFKRIILSAQYKRERKYDLALKLYYKAYNRLHEHYGNSLRWKIVSAVVKRLYNRIASGKRGAALIARKLL